ncbi:hypothetical protein AgCh_024469 [Apium graveolens]
MSINVSSDVGQVIDSTRICKVAEPEKDVSNLLQHQTEMVEKKEEVVVLDRKSTVIEELKTASTIDTVLMSKQPSHRDQKTDIMAIPAILSQNAMLTVMSRMPALPLSINDELEDVIFPGDLFSEGSLNPFAADPYAFD